MSQHWPLSQEANKESGICRVCRATRQLHIKMVPYINMDPETILVLVRTNYHLLFRAPHCLEIPYLLHSQTCRCRCSHCLQYSRLQQRLQVRCGRRYPLLSLDVSPDLLACICDAPVKTFSLGGSTSGGGHQLACNSRMGRFDPCSTHTRWQVA